MVSTVMNCIANVITLGLYSVFDDLYELDIILAQRALANVYTKKVTAEDKNYYQEEYEYEFATTDPEEVDDLQFYTSKTTITKGEVPQKGPSSGEFKEIRKDVISYSIIEKDRNKFSIKDNSYDVYSQGSGDVDPTYSYTVDVYETAVESDTPSYLPLSTTRQILNEDESVIIETTTTEWDSVVLMPSMTKTQRGGNNYIIHNYSYDDWGNVVRDDFEEHVNNQSRRKVIKIEYYHTNSHVDFDFIDTFEYTFNSSDGRIVKNRMKKVSISLTETGGADRYIYKAYSYDSSGNLSKKGLYLSADSNWAG